MSRQKTIKFKTRGSKKNPCGPARRRANPGKAIKRVHIPDSPAPQLIYGRENETVAYYFPSPQGGYPVLLAYWGKQSRPRVWTRFKTESDRTKALYRFMVSWEEYLKDKQERKKTKKAAVKKAVKSGAVKVGDIYFTSWGYDQTNVNWYRIAEISPSGKSVKLDEIQGKMISAEGGSMSAKTKPDKPIKVRKELPGWRRIEAGYQGGVEIKADYDQYAKKWDGRLQYVSWYA